MALSDWELWACAQQQIRQHGDVAAEMAAMRADELFDLGDLDGHATWVTIVRRIMHLREPPDGATAH